MSAVGANGGTVLKLARPLPEALGMGAELKVTLARVAGDRAEISAPLGDLTRMEAVGRYEARLAALVAKARPEIAGHDLHPDFLSTRKAAGLGLPLCAVQHHHAHILATQWSEGWEGPVLGLALDGFGLGPGGQSWGGELLLVEGPGYRRLGHLAPLAQPGGDAAARAPWRMAAAALHKLGRGDEIASRFAGQPQAGQLRELLEKGVNAPLTTSAGRLFDAAAGLLGLCPVATSEGEAPMALEALVAQPEEMAGGYSLDAGQLELAPLLNELPGMDPARGAALFHGTLAAGLAEMVLEAAEETGLDRIALGGGVFFNKVLTARLTGLLSEAGLKVLYPARIGPGDAGLSLGQAVAAALTIERKSRCA